MAGPLRPSFICQARALRSRIYADLTCSEIRPSWMCGQSWIEVAVPEAALSFVERRQRHVSVRLYCSDSLVKHARLLRRAGLSLLRETAVGSAITTHDEKQ